MRIFSKKTFLHSAILALLILFGLLFYANSFNSPLERDEGEYAYSAWLLKNDIMPYENSFLQKPPIIIYYYYAGLLINPDAVWPPRMIAFIFTILCAILLGFIARKEFGAIAGTAAMFLFIPMDAFPFLAPFAANTERFMQLPLIGALAVYIYFGNKKNFQPLFWAGLLGCAALLTKPVCLAPLLFLFVFWVLERSRLIQPLKKITKKFAGKLLGLSSLSGEIIKNRSPQKLTKGNLLIALKCSVFITLGMLAGFFLTCGYFLLKVSHKYLWETWVVFNQYYAAQFDIGNFSKYAVLFAENWWLLLFFIFWIILRRLRHWKFYISLLLLSFISVMVSPIGHYYLLAIPFWTIICAAAIGDIGLLLNKKMRTSIGKFISPIVLIVLTLVLIIYPISEQFKRSPQQMELWIYGFGNPFIEAKIVADKLKEITTPADKVFIAGSEPEILFYSKRISSSRFNITYPLIIDTPSREEYQKKAISELEKNPPAAIVFSNKEESGLWNNESPKIFIDYLKKLLKDNYILVGGYVQNKSDINQYGSWQERVNETDASLLLYKRK